MANPRTVFDVKLLKAVQDNNITMVQKLLNRREICEVKLNDERYFDYHLIVKALSKSQIPLAKLLIDKGFRVYKEPKVEKTILEYAIRLEDTDLIKAVLAKGASSDILTSNKQNKTPFHVAVNMNQLSTIELFLSHFDDVKALDEKNLLHYAIEKQNIDIIAKLAEKGLSLTKKNEKNLTPFCLAFNNPSKNHRFNTLDCLLSHFTVEKLNLDNTNNRAPAYIASIFGNLQLVKNYADFGLSINTPLTWFTKPWSCLDDYSGFTLLHCAVKHIKLDIVEFLLSAGADICVEDANGSTPLHIAFERKEMGIWATWQDFEDNNSIIDLMLKASLKSKSIPINKNGLSHFHIACSRDESTVVEHFLKLGASINQPVTPECHLYKAFSPLHFAVKFRCVKTLESLLKHGADVKQRDFKKRTALHIAARESSPDGVSLLLQYGADITSMDPDGNSPLHLAFKEKNYAVIDALLTAHYKNHSNPVNADGVSHFHIACTRSNVNVVKSFIDSGVSVDTCVPTLFTRKTDSYYVSGWSGYSPLHFAVSHNSSKIVPLLLESGANVGIKDINGLTPLHLVCQYNYKMFREFIENTLCNLSQNGEIDFQHKPITDVVEVSEKYFNGFSGTIGKICWTSHRAEHLRIINSLLNFNSDVNCTDNNNNTPVYHACAAVRKLNSGLDDDLHCSKALSHKISKDLFAELSERSKPILDNLLSVEVNLGKCYKNGSILHYMCSRDDDWSAKTMKVFLKKGADVNDKNDEMLTPLQQAVSIGNVKVVETLLEFDTNVNCIRPEDNSTLIMTAILKVRPWYRCASIIKRLVDKGVNVNARHSDGRTALHVLASQDNVYNFEYIEKVVSAFAKAGANINSRDSKGRTPLYIACSKASYVITRCLLIYGADVNAEDDEGKSGFCDLYKMHLGCRSTRSDVMFLARELENHIIKMKAIGMSPSEKVLRCYVKSQEFPLQSDQMKQGWTNKCNSEVQALRDTKINNHSTLYSAIHKDENTLSQLVKNSTFKSIVRTSLKKKFPVYGPLIQLKYQEGVDRADLLPIAKSLLDNLAKQHLHDDCSEHICKYFTNFELKECIETLSCFLDCNTEKSDDNSNQLKTRRAKRQKVC